MRRSTGLALVAIGAILAFAVHAHLAILNLKLTGLVLIITGLAGLRVPQRAYRWLRSHRDQLRDALDRFMEAPDYPPRVPLDTLLHAEATAAPPAGRRG
jgi:uncharacterized protein YjeT (DUF2065 family)